MTPSLWDLFGPRRFLARVRRRISDGLATTILVPSLDMADELFLEAQHGEARLEPVMLDTLASGSEQELVTDLAAILGLDAPYEEAADLHGAHRHVDQLWLTVTPGSGAEVALSVRDEVLSAGKNLPGYERVDLVLVVAGVPEEAVLTRDEEHLWWWGLPDVHDVMSHASALAEGSRIDPITLHIAAGLCGPDIWLAEEVISYLTAHPRVWAVDALDTVLPPEDLAFDIDRCLAAGQESSPRDLLDDWAAGHVAWLDSRLWIHPAALDANQRRDEADYLRCAAQHRLVLPLVERGRRALIRRIFAATDVPSTVSPPPESLRDEEIGPLTSWVDDRGRFHLSSQEKAVMRHLHTARRRAAHQEAVDRSLQARLQEVADILGAGVGWL